MKISIWTHHPAYRDGNVFSDFTYIGVRHCILQDVRIKLNINKLRRILKVVIPCMITADTLWLAPCYCSNFTPVRRDENDHMNQEGLYHMNQSGELAGLI